MLVRIVKGVSGKVPLQMELRLRFDYGRIVPWVQRSGNTLHAIAGPDAVRLQSDVALRGENLATIATFDLAEGDSVSFCLSWYESYREAPGDVDAAASSMPPRIGGASGPPGLPIAANGTARCNVR